MQPDIRQKIEKYVANAFTAAQLKENESSQLEIANARARLSSRGNLFSSAMDHEMIRIHSEKINRLLKARGDALLDAYELYEVPLEEGEILKDVELMRQTLISATSSAAQQEDSLMALRTGRNDPSGNMRYGNVTRQLTIKSQTIANDLICQIEQRKVTPKIRKANAGINISYHLQDNARLNIHSTDQSVNSITVNQEQLFSAIRDVVTKEISGTDQEKILSTLDDLERAQGQKTFGEKLASFIAVSADFMTLLTPFMPALAELAKRSMGA